MLVSECHSSSRGQTGVASQDLFTDTNFILYGGIKKFFHVHDNILQISTIDDTKSESETKSKNQGLIYEKTSLLQIG